MRPFPIKGGLAAALIAAASSLAYAQVPTPLSPAPPPPPQELANPPEPSPTGIVSGSLDAVDAASAGLLDPDSGGLPANLWTASSKAAIQSILPNLPVASGGMAANDLAMRLLLTRAQAPSGAAAAGDSLLAIKLARLMAQGDLDALIALQPNLGSLAQDGKAARILGEADLLADKAGEAAALCEAALKTSNDPFWLKLNAFLLAQNGDAARTDLALSMARDQDGSDPSFFPLMEALLQKSKIEAPKSPSILDLAVMRALKLSPPQSALQTQDPAVLRYFAQNGDLDFNARLGAAEKLASLGLGDPKLLADLYANVAFKDAERASALATAQKSPGTRAHALLFQIARNAPTPGDQAAAAVGALTLAKDLGHVEILAQLNHTVVQSLPTPPAMLGFAGGLGRIMLLDGDIPGALKWYESFRPLAAPDSKEAFDLAMLGVLITIGDPAGAYALNQSELDLVLRKAQSWPSDLKARRLSSLLSALDALGVPLPASAWNSAIGATARQAVDLAALRAAKEASQAGRIGESVVLALTLMAETGPAQSDPLALSEALLALTRVKLNAEARRIAVEALIGHGL